MDRVVRTDIQNVWIGQTIRTDTQNVWIEQDDKNWHTERRGCGKTIKTDIQNT